MLFCVAVISAIVVFKKKAVKILLSFVLVVGMTVALPKKSFADENVIITTSAELSKDHPAQLTITNNGLYPISVNSLSISNQALPADTT